MKAVLALLAMLLFCVGRDRARHDRARDRGLAARGARRCALLPLREPDLRGGLRGQLQGAAAPHARSRWRTSRSITRGLAAQNKGAGRIRDVRLSEIKERTIEGVRVMQVQPPGRLGRQHDDLHDRVAADRAGPELLACQRLAEARVDRQQLRGLPALAGGDRGDRGPLAACPPACPPWRAAAGIGDNHQQQ